jgi:hypothetical protein
MQSSLLLLRDPEGMIKSLNRVKHLIFHRDELHG